MREVLYTTKQQRTDALDEAKTLNEVLLHDDFDVGPSGENRLTFIPYIEPVPSPDELRQEELRGKLAGTKTNPNAMTLNEMKEMLRLERGL